MKSAEQKVRKIISQTIFEDGGYKKILDVIQEGKPSKDMADELSSLIVELFHHKTADIAKVFS